MLWLWYVAPVAALVIWFLTGLRGRHEARRDREIARFRKLMAPKSVVRAPAGYRGARETTTELPGPREVHKLPGPHLRMVQELGGTPVTHIELVDKLAYVSILGPGPSRLSECQAVVAKLAKAAPPFEVYPLPTIDGKPIPNTGVQIKNDAEFMEQFMIAGQDAKAIGKWLSRRVRGALRELPEAWLHVQERTMALVLYGPVDAERLRELVVAADALFAERGAEGGPSLLPEDDDGKADAEDDGEEDEGEEGGDGREDEPSSAEKAEAPAAAGKD
jgi:hypothetical protein